MIPRIGWRKAKAMSCKHLLLIYGTENTESFVLIVLVAYGWSFQMVSYPKIVLFIGISSMTISASSGIFEAPGFSTKKPWSGLLRPGFFWTSGSHRLCCCKACSSWILRLLAGRSGRSRRALYKRNFLGEKPKGETTKSSLKPSCHFSRLPMKNTFKSLICRKSQGDFNIEHPQ